MKITLKQSGGFAGISLPPKTLETSDETIISLANEAISSKDIETTAGLDMMNYSISIEDGGKTSHIQIKDRLPPEKVQSLIDLVIRS